MQPNSEPSQADVAAVNAHLGGQPAPAELAPQPTPQTPAPEPLQQPAPVTPQPAPTQQTNDPFATAFASEPGQPTEPPTPQPQQPTEPVQPAPEPAPQAPAQTPAPVDEAPTYETYEEYIARVTAGIPQAQPQPDPELVDPTDPAAIKGFFDELVNTAVTKAQAEAQRTTAIQSAERRAWDEAFEFSPTLKSNKKLRDMVHNIRIANFQRGVAMTPIQAAQELLDLSGASYNKGIVDNQVVTTYEAVQPNGGQSGAPIETSLDRETTLQAVQTGGEQALADILAKEIAAGRTW